MAKFSEDSLRRLKTCHEIIQEILFKGIEVIDFAVVEGHRPVDRQQQLYAQGRTAPGPIVTNVDGITIVGRHNRVPSEAADCCPWKPNVGLAWKDRESFSVMGGVFLGIASQLNLEYPVRWGGNWDRDPYFNEKGDNWDLPHLEVMIPH